MDSAANKKDQPTISRQQVLYLANLAKIELSEEEVAAYQRELKTILDYVGQLQNLDLSSYQPIYQVNGQANPGRDDQIIANDDQLFPTPEELLKNLGLKRMVDGQFKVTKTL